MKDERICIGCGGKNGRHIAGGACDAAPKPKGLQLVGQQVLTSHVTKQLVRFDVYVDVLKLAQAIGWKALRGKSKKSQLQHGAVEVRASIF